MCVCVYIKIVVLFCAAVFFAVGSPHEEPSDGVIPDAPEPLPEAQPLKGSPLHTSIFRDDVKKSDALVDGPYTDQNRKLRKVTSDDETLPEEMISESSRTAPAIGRLRRPKPRTRSKSEPEKSSGSNGKNQRRNPFKQANPRRKKPINSNPGNNLGIRMKPDQTERSFQHSKYPGKIQLMFIFGDETDEEANTETQTVNLIKEMQQQGEDLSYYENKLFVIDLSIYKKEYQRDIINRIIHRINNYSDKSLRQRIGPFVSKVISVKSVDFDSKHTNYNYDVLKAKARNSGKNEPSLQHRPSNLYNRSKNKRRLQTDRNEGKSHSQRDRTILEEYFNSGGIISEWRSAIAESLFGFGSTERVRNDQARTLASDRTIDSGRPLTNRKSNGIRHGPQPQHLPKPKLTYEKVPVIYSYSNFHDLPEDTSSHINYRSPSLYDLERDYRESNPPIYFHDPPIRGKFRRRPAIRRKSKPSSKIPRADPLTVPLKDINLKGKRVIIIKRKVPIIN